MVTFSSVINSAVLWWSISCLGSCVQRAKGCPDLWPVRPPCWSNLCLLLVSLPTPAWVPREKYLKALLLECFQVPSASRRLKFLPEVYWCEWLTLFSWEIVDVGKTTCGMLFFRPPSVSQQPWEHSSLYQSRWETAFNLGVSPRSSQKSIKKHLLHSVGSSCWGFCYILSSTNPGNANVAWAHRCEFKNYIPCLAKY